MQAEWSNPQKKPPTIDFQRDPRFPLISWFMYDVDSPYPTCRETTPLLHYARVNVPCSEEASKILFDAEMADRAPLVAYLPPNPPEHISHCYQVMIVGHARPVDVPTETERLRASGRASWDYKGFMRRWGMVRLHQKYFMSTGAKQTINEDG